MTLAINGCWPSKYFLNKIKPSRGVVENSTLPWHCVMSSQLLDYSSGPCFWMDEKKYWWMKYYMHFQLYFNLIIITYTLPTYYLPTYLLIITYTLHTCYLFAIVTCTYILHTYLPRYLHIINQLFQLRFSFCI
jgi:hypothetical protein